jgi:uncharacterized membrane protein YkgB
VLDAGKVYKVAYGLIVVTFVVTIGVTIVVVLRRVELVGGLTIVVVVIGVYCI